MSSLARVLAVEVAAVRQPFGGGHFPCVVRLFAFAPPLDENGKLFELDGRGFGVVLPPFGQRLFVIPVPITTVAQSGARKGKLKYHLNFQLAGVAG